MADPDRPLKLSVVIPCLNAAGLIPVLALAFHHFDVARDTPA